MTEKHSTYFSLSFLWISVSTYLGFSALYLVTFWALWTVGDWSQLALAVALTLPLIWLSACDLRYLELPDVGSICVAQIGVVFVIYDKAPALVVHLLTASSLTAGLWLYGEIYFRRTGQERLGIGDAKLFGAGALLLGPKQLPELFILASFGGILECAVSCLHLSKPRQGIPFGPYIAYAIFVLSFLNPLFL